MYYSIPMHLKRLLAFHISFVCIFQNRPYCRSLCIVLCKRACAHTHTSTSLRTLQHVPRTHTPKHYKNYMSCCWQSNCMDELSSLCPGLVMPGILTTPCDVICPKNLMVYKAYLESMYHLQTFLPWRWGHEYACACCLPSFTGKPQMPIRIVLCI
jgi:hypothetical protein